MPGRYFKFRQTVDSNLCFAVRTGVPLYLPPCYAIQSCVQPRSRVVILSPPLWMGQLQMEGVFPSFFACQTSYRSKWYNVGSCTVYA